MSADKKKSENVGYTPTKPPRDLPAKEPESLPPQSAHEPLMTAAQFQGMQVFFKDQVLFFKQLFEESKLAKYIIMAGIGGVVVAGIETVRAFVDLVVYFRK